MKRVLSTLLLLHDPLSPGQLGQLSEISSSGTITGAIDRLEHAGYVRRVRCTADRRKVYIELDLDHLAAADTGRARRLAAVATGYDDQLAVISDFLTRLPPRPPSRSWTKPARRRPARAPTRAAQLRFTPRMEHRTRRGREMRGVLVAAD